MSLNIFELFGFSPSDPSDAALGHRSTKSCPFLRNPCAKRFRDGVISGVCSVITVNQGPVICCPIRLYAEDYRCLNDIAKSAFEGDFPLAPPDRAVEESASKPVVAVFGKRWGHELRLPSRAKERSGGYFVDWILVKLSGGVLSEFVALEVQSIDTTGNYRAEYDAYMRGIKPKSKSVAGLNWENVSKRILPQIIYKGHVLRRENLCKKGLYFISPRAVYERILERLGGNLQDYAPHQGTLTFIWYDLNPDSEPGKIHKLELKGTKTTTVDQVAMAFVNPTNLPPAGVYEDAIKQALNGIN